ncbi:fused MFS/spermidine synthase [Erythrobacter sp. SDW2]|uniref:spermidine synthase n=1 Tax=Erythrobacter sp. SDW2 TaxID=2907154 RepID=UPI001F1BF553|nr:fused MFS/spermidine synthase [Erythrobacter sp. SDW2]UIP07342.1 fused MFS/spermidine synthase [Erythrobacter sp. SDW2]
MAELGFDRVIRTNRWLFVCTVLAGSFLLFLVQPMVARMALPRLGGAPAVWNSAMLVYQALLLAGYAYAHLIGRFSIRRQASIHLAVLLLAALTLPISLADLPPAASGWEAAWVPLLFALTIGPVFFAVSAQAPLMQRWYAADPAAGDPYWLYAASNLGSFAGLLAYPLLFEPFIRLGGQSWVWTLGYGVLIVLVMLAAWSRRNAGASPEAAADARPAEPIGWRRIALWLALSAVPSGLMLSTTTHLTTDIVAMPLLWVIPLGLYLLSFSIAFREESRIGSFLVLAAPLIALFTGGQAMASSSGGSFLYALASLLLLMAFAVALHHRLYADRPGPERLTLFYLVMSAGGALGGLFTALIAPMVFDWVWEHPLLILSGAALLPRSAWSGWYERLGLGEERRRTVVLALLLAVFAGGYWMQEQLMRGNDLGVTLAMCMLAAIGLLLLIDRPAFLIALLAMMLARSGFDTVEQSWAGARERSFFGVYAVREQEEQGFRDLVHGTTLHGRQLLHPARALEPTTYYTRNGGAGLVLAHAPELVGPEARIGVVGLGVGTLGCYRQPGQQWEFFEIDPVVLEYSQAGHFTFLERCTPDAPTHIGDARIVLEDMEPARFDILAIDAFSSDAIPLHLMTREAFGIYSRVLSEDGILLVHVSNRFLDLAPMVNGLARANGMEGRIRRDTGRLSPAASPSWWIALARDEALLERLPKPEKGDWDRLPDPPKRVWSDDFASILPFLQWESMLETSHD